MKKTGKIATNQTNGNSPLNLSNLEALNDSLKFKLLAATDD